jgi:hypothetical protein
LAKALRCVVYSWGHEDVVGTSRSGIDFFFSVTWKKGI